MSVPKLDLTWAVLVDWTWPRHLSYRRLRRSSQNKHGIGARLGSAPQLCWYRHKKPPAFYLSVLARSHAGFSHWRGYKTSVIPPKNRIDLSLSYYDASRSKTQFSIPALKVIAMWLLHLPSIDRMLMFSVCKRIGLVTNMQASWAIKPNKVTAFSITRPSRTLSASIRGVEFWNNPSNQILPAISLN